MHTPTNTVSNPDHPLEGWGGTEGAGHECTPSSVCPFMHGLWAWVRRVWHYITRSSGLECMFKTMTTEL